MANKLKLSLSPHVHSGDSVSKNMRWVIIAMLPAMLWSFYTFGLGAVIVTATSVASCVFFEWAINKFILKNDQCTLCDYSAVVTGILLAFNLPANLPLYIIIIGALFAIGVVKMTFGGLGCNLFNPALAARVFLLISFPVKMTMFPAVGQMTAYADAVTAATPLATAKTLADTSLWDLFLGNVGGSLGEVSALCLLIGLVILLVSRTITWHIPVSILATVLVLSGLLHIAYPVEVATPWHHLFGGGLMLGAVFMATDYVTSPMTAKGQLIYGFCIGFLTVAIRVFGAYPEGMSFAILIMNAFVPLINNACKPQRFAIKDMESYVLEAINKCFVFKGRACRKEYWSWILFTILISIIICIFAAIIKFTIPQTTPWMIAIVYLFSLVLFFPTLSITFRRLHDINRSGWWYVAYLALFVTNNLILINCDLSAILICFLSLVVLAYLIILLVWFCTKGDTGLNKYGQDPKYLEVKK